MFDSQSELLVRTWADRQINAASHALWSAREGEARPAPVRCHAMGVVCSPWGGDFCGCKGRRSAKSKPWQRRFGHAGSAAQPLRRNGTCFEAPRSRKEALPAPWTFGNPLQRTRCDSRPAPVRSPHPPHQLFAFVFSASKLRAWLGVWTNRIQNGGTKALPRTAMRGPARHETNARDLRRSTPGQLPSERTQDDSTGVHD